MSKRFFGMLVAAVVASFASTTANADTPCGCGQVVAPCGDCYGSSVVDPYSSGGFVNNGMSNGVSYGGVVDGGAGYAGSAMVGGVVDGGAGYAGSAMVGGGRDHRISRCCFWWRMLRSVNSVRNSYYLPKPNDYSDANSNTHPHAY